MTYRPGRRCGLSIGPCSRRCSRRRGRRLTMVKPVSSDLCQPRWSTPRNPTRPTLGPALAAIANELGQPLMPWQRLVADVGLELTDDGRPAYREVVFTVPRQSGKTTVILGWAVQRA